MANEHGNDVLYHVKSGKTEDALDKGAKFHYARLSDGEKNIYDKICASWRRFEHALSLHAGMGKEFAVDTQKIAEAVLFDNPEFFYINRGGIAVSQTPMYIQMDFRYTYEKNEAEALWAQVDAHIEKFIKYNIKPEMSTYEKQSAVYSHISLIRAAQAPYEKDDFSLIGALLKNRAACEGYAKAYKLLCQRLGIAAALIQGEVVLPSGTKEPHVWNITRVDGVTAHSDACLEARFGVSSYDYFNLSDAEIRADRVFDTNIYPKCAANTASYFYRNGLVAADEAELFKILAKAAGKPYFAVKLLFPYSREKAERLPLGIGKMSYNAAQNIINFVHTMLE